MGKPNFVLIMADDMGYGDFGVFSEGRVRTPFLDSLIGESICLSQNYTGSPVCSPSRAAMLIWKVSDPDGRSHTRKKLWATTASPSAR